MSSNEQWQVIKGYTNYLVSTYGRVFSLNKREFLKPFPNKKGYLRVSLSRKGKSNYFSIHRLVCLAFTQNCKNKPFVDHINGIITDNLVTNLRWATVQENNRSSRVSCKSTTGVKGVGQYSKNGTFQAYIYVDNVMTHLGFYNTIEEAKQIRAQFANKLFGEFTHSCERI